MRLRCKRSQQTITKELAPTLSTVAQLANVSVASASRVLNGIKTNPETLAAVTAAAERVGYVPHHAARSLRSRRTGQIAFAMPDIANPVYTQMVSAIQSVVQEHGNRLLLHSTGADLEEELEIVRDLKRRFVDGLIIVSLRLGEEHGVELAAAAAPVVVLGRPAKELLVDTVRANSRRGAAEAIRHLAAAGRTRIAFLNGPQDTAPGISRRQGYLDGLRASGLRRDDALIEVVDDFTIEAGRSGAEALFARTSPDALFCANDLLAVGALAALREADCDVPHEVAVVGMDNTSLCDVTWPPLTTIDLGSAERARLAAELLLARLEHPRRRPRSIGVEPKLVVRHSCGVAR